MSAWKSFEKELHDVGGKVGSLGIKEDMGGHQGTRVRYMYDRFSAEAMTGLNQGKYDRAVSDSLHGPVHSRVRLLFM